MSLTIKEAKVLTFCCRNEKYHSRTIRMTKDQCRGRINSRFNPDTNTFSTLQKSVYTELTKQDVIELAEVSEQQKNQCDT